MQTVNDTDIILDDTNRIQCEKTQFLEKLNRK